MATVINESIVQPAVTMDKMHWESFSFKQTKEENPMRTISASYCMYGIDENGTQVFDKVSHGVHDADVDATIITDYVTKGGTAEEFATAYTNEKNALATLIAAGEVSDAKLMVYFEMVMARTAELKNGISVATVE